MMRPITCLSLLVALGAGLYLYQEKHRAQMLDRDITKVIKQADAARERIGYLKAEWEMLDEPQRLAALASRHLPQLQPLTPAQFAHLQDLPNRLPAVPSDPARPSEPPPLPLAAKTPASTPDGGPARRAVQLAQAPISPAPDAAPAVHKSAGVLTPHLPAIPAKLPAAPRPLFAPVVPAYTPAPVVVHAPTVQTASVMLPPQMPGYTGSALGTGRSALSAPVPVASPTGLSSGGSVATSTALGTTLGYAAAR